MDNNDVLQHELDEYEGHDTYAEPAAEPMDAEELGGVGVGIEYLLGDDSADYPPAKGSYKKLALGGTPKKIEARHLERGDILISTTATKLSRAIRDHTGMPVSHAFIYVGDGKVIEADGPVDELTLTDALKNDYYAAAYRMPGLTKKDRDGIVNFLRGKIGDDFDYYGMIRHLVKITPQDDDAWYCSELVFAAYKSIGKPLEVRTSKDKKTAKYEKMAPHDTYPGHIMNIRNIVYVGHVLVPPYARSSVVKAKELSIEMALWGAGAMSAADSELERAIKFAMDAGATRQQAEAHFAENMVANSMELHDGTHMPIAYEAGLGDWLYRALKKVIETLWIPVDGIINAIFAICNKFNVSLAVGIGGSMGAGTGIGTGSGIVFLPGNKIAYYGSTAKIFGYIVEVGVSLDVTVVKGGKEVFDGRSLVVGGSVDASSGPGGGFREIVNKQAQVVGFVFQLTFSIGAPGFAAGEFTTQVTDTWSKVFYTSGSKSLAYGNYPMMSDQPNRRGQMLPPPPAAAFSVVADSPWR